MAMGRGPRLQELESINPTKGAEDVEEDDETLNSLSDEEKLARSQYNHQVAPQLPRYAATALLT